MIVDLINIFNDPFESNLIKTSNKKILKILFIGDIYGNIKIKSLLQEFESFQVFLKENY